MKILSKTLVGTVAAGAMAVSAAAPSSAQDWRRDHDRHRDNGIGAGEVIAGALIIGGIAAIAAGANNNRNRDRRWNDGWGTPRSAIEQCVGAAERQANRRSWGGRADVTDIRGVRETRSGYEVRGRIAVNSMNRDWRRGDNQYGRGWGNDYRGWNDNLRGYDAGSFVCRIDRGRVGRIDFNGIRGL